MGYRSDVRIITSKKGYDHLMKFVRNAVNDDINQNLLEQCDIKSVHHDCVYMGWDDIKWYEGSDYYKDIDAIMDGLRDLDNNYYSYRYARIGEDYDDYEEKYADSEDDELKWYPSLNRKFEDNEILQSMAFEDAKYRTEKTKGKDENVL